MRVFWLVLLLLGACRAPPPDDDREPATDPSVVENPEPAGLPAGFEVVGTGSVDTPALPPDAMWRFLVSKMHDLRAEARAQEQDLLVTFGPDAVHVTDRQGRRRTWQLPPGLRLEDGPRHVVLGADLRAAVYASDGTQVESEEEITVIRARIDPGSGNVEEFRLIIKGGRTFRSISTAG